MTGKQPADGGAAPEHGPLKLRAHDAEDLAALAADGETLLNRVYHLDRGYERVEEKLAACGAEIERIK